MKLSGNSRGGRHVGNGSYSGDSVSVSKTGADKQARSGGKRPAASKNGKNKPKRTGAQRVVRFVSIFLLVIAALSAGVMAWLKASVKPPDINETLQPNQPTGVSPDANVSEGEAPDIDGDGTPDDVGFTEPSRKRKYTFVVLGTDDGNGNTDTIMIASFDVDNYKLDVVNIPRDTLASFNGKGIRINAMYASIKGKTPEEKMPVFISCLADTLGFEVDFYAIVDLNAFKTLVDAIDGVDFYIPQNMKHTDPEQNLYINFTKGDKHLNGKEALELVRYRGYGTADIGRIEMQQKFLLETAKQILAKKSSIKIDALADIFLNDVETDLNFGNLIWFAREMLKMDAEDISFTTAPADYWSYDYVILFPNEWLKVVNEKLSPLNVEITTQNVHILTRSSGGSSNSNSSSSSNSSSNSNNSSNSNSSSNSTNNNNSSGGGSDSTPSPSTEPSTTPSDDPVEIPTDTETPPEFVPPVSETPNEVEPPVETLTAPPAETGGVIIPGE